MEVAQPVPEALVVYRTIPPVPPFAGSSGSLACLGHIRVLVRVDELLVSCGGRSSAHTGQGITPAWCPWNSVLQEGHRRLWASQLGSYHGQFMYCEPGLVGRPLTGVLKVVLGPRVVRVDVVPSLRHGLGDQRRDAHVR